MWYKLKVFLASPQVGVKLLLSLSNACVLWLKPLTMDRLKKIIYNAVAFISTFFLFIRSVMFKFVACSKMSLIDYSCLFSFVYNNVYKWVEFSYIRFHSNDLGNNFPWFRCKLWEKKMFIFSRFFHLVKMKIMKKLHFYLLIYVIFFFCVL